ncbi:hypothetical protein KEJ45_02930 [Candidatus Bathyarchaeota archaeon]|nr:hypothetical protein [Candidatus Bathyarchaeota archaeon]
MKKAGVRDAMTLSELVKMLGDFAEIIVTVLLAYVVYKIAVLIDTLGKKVKMGKTEE